MGRKNPGFDTYAANAQPFARPIFKHLRTVVHEVVPEVTEEFKWSHPSWVYKGILCGFAAFKEHATFGFAKHDLVVGKGRKEGAWGTFGRITTVKDLPSKAVLTKLLKKAKQLNDDGVGSMMGPRKKRAPLPVPAYMKSALARDAKAKAVWDEFPPGQQREYVEWVIEAKTEETREKRLATSLEWIAEGKRRNWKYER